ncbi:MAG: YegS/Rv2252/BmrU family lipid kinase [Rhodospirillales bacterium]|nr:YegS/Rv2252/BmrU family lipid kinase [Rhodospirillales bacterium]MCW8951890.1 YegS/Rv2252/BmrU family lipid kinase [Rhodospirillales bacterium]MCW9001142.1 YegS/Rv2252/BmrU family lipid kinase [Rhodospirillales bacterium]
MKRRTVTVIVNSHAGSGRKKRFLQDVLGALRTGQAQVTVQETVAPGHATQLARGVDGSDLVVIAGGDGTVNEVLNGLPDGFAGELAVIPIGTANVFARELGLPGSAKQLAGLFLNGPSRDFYVGQVNGRKFACMAGIGFDAQTVTNLNPATKRRFGKLAYIVAALRVLMSGDWREITVERDDGPPSRAVHLVFCKSGFYGGAFQAHQRSSIFARNLGVVSIDTARRWALIRFVLASLLGRSPAVDLAEKTVLVTAPASLPVQLDGDCLETTPCAVSICDMPLRIVHNG